jgi:glyoxylase-like metal-dependent hydrolase (beta-lactamase superfamily II)
MKAIAPNLYTFEGLIAGRAYLIEDPDGLTIIDGSLPNSTEKLISQINASGRRVSDIKRILLTHAHGDHVGALPALHAQSGAPIITSEVEKPYAEGTLPIARPASGLKIRAQTIKGITVDRTVSDGDVIDAMGGLQVIATPGHSPGHISFWQPERKILIAGDVLMHMFGLRLPFAMATPDMPENIRSIKKIAQLNPEIICFGHGEPLTTNADTTLRAFAAHL